MDVKEERKRIGITQEELARLLGVTVNTVSRWENGRHRPSRLAQKELKALVVAH